MGISYTWPTKPAALPPIKVYYQTPKGKKRDLHCFGVGGDNLTVQEAISLVREQLKQDGEKLVGPILALIQGR